MISVYPDAGERDDYLPCLKALDIDLLTKIFAGHVLIGMQVCKSWSQDFPRAMHVKIRIELMEGWQLCVPVISKNLSKFPHLSTCLSIRLAVSFDIVCNIVAERQRAGTAEWVLLEQLIYVEVLSNFQL